MGYDDVFTPEVRANWNNCSKCGKRVSSSKARRADRVYIPETGYDHVTCEVGERPSFMEEHEHRQAIRQAVMHEDRLPP
jgi:hypothetical protein